MNSDVVINQKNQNRYSVSNYNLKVLQSTLPDLPPVESGVVHKGFKSFDEIETLEAKKNAPLPVEKEESAGSDFDPVEPDKDAQAELIESLLKKADDASSKYLKAQMAYEELEEKAQANEAKIRAEAFAEGEASAKEGLALEQQAKEEAAFSQLDQTMQTLMQESNQFSTALESVKQELVAAALDIAKEVILKEISQDANAIALTLAESLIADIDKESRIKLKVHPTQVALFQRHIATTDRITVEGDSAISLGGVVVLSKTGTIEADIMSRYEQIKRSALHS